MRVLSKHPEVSLERIKQRHEGGRFLRGLFGWKTLIYEMFIITTNHCRKEQEPFHKLVIRTPSGLVSFQHKLPAKGNHRRMLTKYSHPWTCLTHIFHSKDPIQIISATRKNLISSTSRRPTKETLFLQGDKFNFQCCCWSILDGAGMKTSERVKEFSLWKKWNKTA